MWPNRSKIVYKVSENQEGYKMYPTVNYSPGLRVPTGFVLYSFIKPIPSLVHPYVRQTVEQSFVPSLPCLFTEYIFWFVGTRVVDSNNI